MLNTGIKILDKIKVNKKIRQTCSLLATLFSIYIDNLLKILRLKTTQKANLLYTTKNPSFDSQFIN